ncbi:hypothetical protein QQ045_029544 [Rhodiola kirilowii]
MNIMLTGEVTEEKIRKAAFQMGPTKVPGPDGFSAVFYQSCWGIIKEDLVREIFGFFKEFRLDPEWNKTCIVLVPKVRDVQTMVDLRPISLYNVSMKIVTKILANRLQLILGEVIFAHQTSKCFCQR